MDSANRLQVVSRIAYYGGWILAVFAGLVHFGIGVALFHSVELAKRNLFEGSVMLFLISVASSLRALSSSRAT